MNCEKIESVTSHNLYPLSQTVTLSQTPSPLERDILYGRPQSSDHYATDNAGDFLNWVIDKIFNWEYLDQ